MRTSSTAAQATTSSAGADSSDEYVFATGDGRDVIFDNGFGGDDVLQLTDFASSDMTVRVMVGDTSNVVLTFATGEEITIINQTDANGGIASFVFTDTTLTDADILALATAGSPPGDVFTGDNLSNTLSGNGGNDTLKGLGGDDTYVYDAGDQRVDIEGNGNSLNDAIIINGYSSTDARYVPVPGVPNDLRIVFGSGDELTVRNGLTNNFNDVIETVTFNSDGVTLNGITSDSITATRAADNPASVILTMADGNTIRLENSLPSGFADTVDQFTFVGEGVTRDMQFLRDFILALEATAPTPSMIWGVTAPMSLSLSGETSQTQTSRCSMKTAMIC